MSIIANSWLIFGSLMMLMLWLCGVKLVFMD